VTHLGQRLSALIDGELAGSERERVLWHMARCDSCCAEAAALRTLKRKLGELGDTDAGAGLTGRLMGLSALASMADREPADPAAAPPPTWPDRPGRPPGRGQASAEQRAGRYFLAGSLAVFLAGLGTAAFIAGGEPQPQAPTPPVAPSVDVMMFPHGQGNDFGTVPPLTRPRPRSAPSAAHTSHTGT
jgi:anti-sigma factor RsiW